MSDSRSLQVPAGSRRFWMTVLIFALMNAAAWVGYHRYSISRLHLLRVVKFDPGHEARVGSRPTFVWEFNLDVSHDATKNGVETMGTITPPVAGKWLWHSGRMLTFTPAQDLPRATKFTLALSADRVRTADGIRLDKAFSETFTTAPLKLLAARQSAFDEEHRLVIELEFDDIVIPVDAMKHLVLKDPEWRFLGFHAQGAAAGKIVRVQTDPLPQLRDREEAFVFLQISPGLAGSSGPLGIAEEFSQKLAIATDLMATDAVAHSPGSGDANIHLRFNNTPDLESLRQVLSVEPAVKFNLGMNYEGIAITGPFQPGNRYAIRIAKAPVGSDARKFPRPDVLSAFVPDRSPQVWFEHTEGYLGSQGNRILLAHAVNVDGLKVTLTRIYDNNLVTWRNTVSGHRWEDPNPFALPIATKSFSLANVKNQPQDVRVSLDELLPADAPRDGVYRIGLSADVATVSHPRYRRRGNISESDEDDSPNESASAIVTLSDIGLTAKQTRGGIHLWAVSLSTAKPLADVRVRAFSNKSQALGEVKTDKDGLAVLASLHPAAGEHVAVLLAEIAETGPRLAGEAQQATATIPQRGLTWLDLAGSEVNFSSFDVAGKPYLRGGYEAFLYTDRGVYRPGETAHLRAIVRGPDLASPPSFPVRWQLRRPDLRDWKAEIVKLDADGAALLDVNLPADLPTGRWSADLALPGENGKPGQSFGTVSFQVEEFMPNRMKMKLDVTGEVAAKNTDRISIEDGGLIAQVQADYLFGKPVTERPATLTARVEPASFSSPKWNGWTFNDAANTSEALGHAKATGCRIEFKDVPLDLKGHAKWEIDADQLYAGENETRKKSPMVSPSEFAGPWQVTFFSSVTEAGGRAVNSTRTVDVDRLPYYLGVHPAKSSVALGSTLDFEIRSVAPSGAILPVNGPIKVQVYRDTWNTSLIHDNGGYHYNSSRKLEKVGEASTAMLSDGCGTYAVIPSTGGNYVLRIEDGTTGFITSHSFIASSGAWEGNVSREHPEQLEILVTQPPVGTMQAVREMAARFDAAMLVRFWHGHALLPITVPSFHPGESANVIVRAPFAGRLLLSVETDSVLSTRVIDMPAANMSIPIQLPENSRPSAFVTATILRAIDPNAKWRTHRAFGIARLPIDNTDSRLSLKIGAPQEMRPGNTLQVDVQVTDANGHPAVNAAVSVAAVDEGILSLTRFTTPDPFSFFTAARAHGVRWSDLYSRLMPEVARPQGASPVGGDADGVVSSRHQTPITARRVKSVALVSSILHTDEQGRIHTDFQVPEFAGQLRLMAVTYTGKTFGSAQSNIFVRSPLLVQSSWPRFAAPQDRFTVPLVIFNNTKQPGIAEIRLTMTPYSGDENSSDLGFVASKEQELILTSKSIAAGGQTTISFDVIAAARCGIARASLQATMNGESCTENIELPIRPASPAISIGGYAIATPAGPARIGIVDGMLEGTGELQIRAGQFPSLELPRGIEYLDRYPYGCAEQTISGLFPLVALGDLGPQIAPGVFGRDRMERKMQAGITRLIGMQTADGGIAMWPGANEPSWPWASVYAAHFLVEASAAGHTIPEEFREHLMGYVRNLLNQATDKSEVVEAQAYGCYVLALSGKPERAVMSRLTEIINTVKPPKPGYIPIAPEARFHLAAAWLAAGRRDLAVGLIPQTLPSPRSERQLSGNVGSAVRDRAVLVSTLLAIDPDHPAIPAMVQQIADAGKSNGWRSTQDAAFAVIALGKYVRQMKSVEPYESVRLHTDRDNYVAESSDQKALASDPSFDANSKFEIRIQGPEHSKAYVSWLQTGVPIKPAADEDAGMKIRRRYLDARGEPIANGTVRSGDLVQIELTIESLTALENVVIDDLLPAGLEIENARLETTADKRQVNRKAIQSASNFTHGRLDVRDDRLIVMGALHRAGAGQFSYLARAVTPGTFIVPPVRGECMYDIGTHSISGGGQMLKVVDRKVNAVAQIQP